jgi:hypothetical protein
MRGLAKKNAAARREDHFSQAENLRTFNGRQREQRIVRLENRPNWIGAERGTI